MCPAAVSTTDKPKEKRCENAKNMKIYKLARLKSVSRVSGGGGAHPRKKGHISGSVINSSKTNQFDFFCSELGNAVEAKLILESNKIRREKR